MGHAHNYFSGISNYTYAAQPSVLAVAQSVPVQGQIGFQKDSPFSTPNALIFWLLLQQKSFLKLRFQAQKHSEGLYELLNISKMSVIINFNKQFYNSTKQELR